MCTFIKDLPDNIQNCESGRFNLNFLYKENFVYIMDNHLAAGWCWLNELNQEEQYNFIHIDHHGDLQCWGLDSVLDFFGHHPNPTLEEYCNESYQWFNHALNVHENWKLFGYSNYIKLIHRYRPNWFCECYFSTGQEEQDRSMNIVENINSQDLSRRISELLNNHNRQWIVNFDLDFFYDNDGDPEIIEINREYLHDILQAIANHRGNIAVLTIAMSPECCGGWNNAIHLLEQANNYFHLHFPMAF